MAQSSADDTGTGDFDFSDFAQEFLRRNPAYKDQYARLHLRDTGDKKTSAARRMARPKRTGGTRRGEALAVGYYRQDPLARSQAHYS